MVVHPEDPIADGGRCDQVNKWKSFLKLGDLILNALNISPRDKICS